MIYALLLIVLIRVLRYKIILLSECFAACKNSYPNKFQRIIVAMGATPPKGCALNLLIF